MRRWSRHPLLFSGRLLLSWWALLLDPRRLLSRRALFLGSRRLGRALFFGLRALLGRSPLFLGRGRLPWRCAFFALGRFFLVCHWRGRPRGLGSARVLAGPRRRFALFCHPRSGPLCARSLVAGFRREGCARSARHARALEYAGARRCRHRWLAVILLGEQ